MEGHQTASENGARCQGDESNAAANSNDNGDLNDSNNNNRPAQVNGNNSQQANAQDVHTREKLFDFIALLQGRRMDDQRATLRPSS